MYIEREKEGGREGDKEGGDELFLLKSIFLFNLRKTIFLPK